MPQPQPRISDPMGILLRPWEDQDETFLIAACADPEIVRWLPIPNPYDLHAVHAFIRKGREDWRRGRGAAWVIIDQAQHPVGSIGARGP